MMNIQWIHYSCVGLMAFVLTAVLCEETCLLGHMTDVQDWVEENGTLRIKKSVAQRFLDLSNKRNYRQIILDKINQDLTIDVLGLANLNLTKVPDVFQVIVERANRNVSEIFQYISFYGNCFASNLDGVSNTRRGEWYNTFERTKFPHLEELDLRNCKIQRFSNGVFQNMPKLKSLYLSGNNIVRISPGVFTGMHSLLHLDMSMNVRVDNNFLLTPGLVLDPRVFSNLRVLKSLDLSYTQIISIGETFANMSNSLKRLSVCHASMSEMSEFFAPELKILDISGNTRIFKDDSWFRKLRGSLRILRANAIGLKSLDVFRGFDNLEVLILRSNLLTNPSLPTKPITHLKILDLEGNRVTNWFSFLFDAVTDMIYLGLRSNTLNMINDVMLEDFTNITYLSLGLNPFVCTCTINEFLKRAAASERRMKRNDIGLDMFQFDDSIDFFEDFHITYEAYNMIIKNRIRYTGSHDRINADTLESNHTTSQFVMIDYTKKDYRCTDSYKETRVYFEDVESCKSLQRSYEIEYIITRNTYYIYGTAVLVSLILLFIAVVIWKWWYIRYFFVMVKNAATLTLINNDDVVANQDEMNYTYDVFVSYCRGDRTWVLQELLPNIESQTNIRVCLHERDFLAGLTILENIVTCIDRSRNIMLIISQEFLFSQWCQFEMHLAQHRLIETRRENLILVLLEDIPRRRRPNTLHYLMMTKTYMQWKQGESKEIFWKRVKNALQRNMRIHSYV